jgi:hypothetical protein
MDPRDLDVLGRAAGLSVDDLAALVAGRYAGSEEMRERLAVLLDKPVTWLFELHPDIVRLLDDRRIDAPSGVALAMAARASVTGS